MQPLERFAWIKLDLYDLCHFLSYYIGILNLPLSSCRVFLTGNQHHVLVEFCARLPSTALLPSSSGFEWHPIQRL
ncbi:hypothetical protein Gasu2_57880 [Galdieria sulphuraria]|nr:hypothetical protein Gasu2_57880 [Galdieria sulphuraria]